MKKKKWRKPRGRNAHGSMNLDLCEGCGYFQCDPIFDNEGTANRKIRRRLRNGECMGCGQKKDQCKCKSSKHAKRPTGLQKHQIKQIHEAFMRHLMNRKNA